MAIPHRRRGQKSGRKCCWRERCMLHDGDMDHIRVSRGIPREQDHGETRLLKTRERVDHSASLGSCEMTLSGSVPP